MKKLLITVAMMTASIGITPALALDCEDGFRAFKHYAGETCIPLEPQRIVTLQDQNGLLPLMELGVRPVASSGHITKEGDKIFRRMEGYDTTGIEWIGPYGTAIDPEVIATQKPDLIVATPWPDGAAELYSDIAPVVVIDMFEQPLTDALFQFADLVNKTERAQELQNQLNESIAATREELSKALATTTISILTFAGEDNKFYPTNPTQAMGMILRGLEPIRPAAEQGLTDERVYRSMETIGNHNADVMLQLVFDADDRGDSNAYKTFGEMPVVAALPVVKAGQHFPLDGSKMVGSAWGKVENGLKQIATILKTENLDRDIVQE